MKHDGPLYQRKVSPLIKCLLVAKVVNVLYIELVPLAPLDGIVFQLRFKTKLDEIYDC